MRNPVRKICLGPKLMLSSTVECIGLKYEWDEFSKREQELILSADKIYFPTIHYCHLFHVLGKAIFPSLNSYELLGNKIRQTQIFKALGLSHPRTCLFTGKDRAVKICAKFDFPMVGKIPVGSSRGQGVYLIKNMNELQSYLEMAQVAYIQEYIPTDRDIRVVVIGNEVVLAYWRIGKGDDFRTNVARGSRIVFDKVPEEVLSLCIELCTKASIDHAGIDVVIKKGRPMILEANIHFGREGFIAKGMDYKRLLASLADSGKI